MPCFSFCLKFLVLLFRISNHAGHSAVLHGCTVEDEAFVGMGATLLDGSIVEKHAMVAAGALVRQNTRIPCGEVCLGVGLCVCVRVHVHVHMCVCVPIQLCIHASVSFCVSMEDSWCSFCLVKVFFFDR